MKQLRKTEWRREYPIKKNLALCAWGMLALAGFAGILARPENIPSLAAGPVIIFSRDAQTGKRQMNSAVYSG